MLELVHADVIGPIETRTPNGARFALTLVDEYSRFLSVYILKSKSEVMERVRVFTLLMENQLGQRLKCVRTDNGGKFVNHAFTRFCHERGIVHQRTTTYSPQQNGVAERMNRTVVKMARAMMASKQVAKKWWAEAVSTAAYVANRLPNSANPAKSPYEVCFGARPSLSELRVFGSAGYAHIDKSKRQKLDPKSYRCMFLGYAENSKAYRVLDVQSEKVRISLDEYEIGGIYSDSSAALEIAPVSPPVAVRGDADDIDEDPSVVHHAAEGRGVEHQDAQADVDMDIGNRDPDVEMVVALPHDTSQSDAPLARLTALGASPSHGSNAIVFRNPQPATSTPPRSSGASGPAELDRLPSGDPERSTPNNSAIVVFGDSENPDPRAPKRSRTTQPDADVIHYAFALWSYRPTTKKQLRV